MKMIRVFALSSLLLLLTSCAAALRAADDSSAGVELFEKKIRPVLVEQCYSCHSAKAERVQGNLLLDSREGSRRGGESGPAVVPGKPDESLLLSALRYESFEMPPKSKLDEETIADFARWIELGAPDPRDGKPTTSPEHLIDWETASQFWAFQPPTRHPLPADSNADWMRQPIDAFVSSMLKQQGLEPNESAERETFIRRVTFDLIGLPPTPDEVRQFFADRSPDADERLVQRLLASPRYGERWARMWLDVARFAEDQAHIVGNNRSLFYPNAYRYRDWVIDAWNQDLPFDEFIRLQLAADLFQPEATENLVALGFIGLGPKYYRRNALDVMADEWEDRVDTVARGLLGLTVACARCHDHKYDPITTEDYYALAGVFASTEMFNRPLDDERETGKNGEAKKPEDALHIIRDASPTDLNVFIRGDVNNKGPVVERRFLRVLCESEPEVFAAGSGRRQLAEAITAPDNPLTARVFVNRVWSHLFGRGLVETSSNFGQLGTPPTHPELLDDLTRRFIDSGWSLKWLHREITLSATYRQSSRIDAAKQAIDPSNQWLGRMNRRRLSVEGWRDGILSACGQLETKLGGQSFDPQDPQQRRRTVYSEVSRLELNPMLATFDFPDPNAHSAGRVETVTPLQKLFVMNSPFMVRCAEMFSERLQTEASTDESRIQLAHQLLYGREARTEEVELAKQFLTPAESDDSPNSRWQQYAQILFAANEAMIID